MHQHQVAPWFIEMDRCLHLVLTYMGGTDEKASQDRQEGDNKRRGVAAVERGEEHLETAG